MSYETEYTDEIVCPHCERKISYSIDYELSEDPTRIVCNNCDREIWASREIIYRYTTHKVIWKLDGEKKIDRCSLCSNYLNIKDEEDGYPNYNSSCTKHNRTILIDSSNNIESFCELRDTEADND